MYTFLQNLPVAVVMAPRKPLGKISISLNYYFYENQSYYIRYRGIRMGNVDIINT